MSTTIRLHPHRWTELPGTNLALCWQGDQAVELHQRDDLWDLSKLRAQAERGTIWIRIMRHGTPITRPWPILW